MKIPRLLPFNASKIVFLVAPGTAALVATVPAGGKKRTLKAREFKSPGAALAWCERNAAVLIYIPASCALDN